MMPVLAVLLAAVCFGTTGTAQAFAPADATPLSIGAARILVGGALLGVIALLARRARRSRSAGEQPGASALTAPRRMLLLAVGAAGVLLYQPAFFAGTATNGVAIGTVVALGSAPVITGVIDGVLRRRVPSRRWMLATAVATIGVVLISGVIPAGGASAGAGAGVGASADSVSIAGLLASVGAGASYAVYTLASKALLEAGWTPSGTMGAVFGLAAVASIPVLLASGAAWLATPAGLGMALWLGVVTTAIAYLLFGWGLDRLPAATVSTLTLAEPLTATLLGTLLLGETIAPVAAAGLIVLGAGLVILAVPERREAGRTRQESTTPGRPEPAAAPPPSSAA